MVESIVRLVEAVNQVDTVALSKYMDFSEFYICLDTMGFAKCIRIVMHCMCGTRLFFL